MKHCKYFLVIAYLLTDAAFIQAQNVALTLERTIESPRKFIPGVEDKAGYWKDYGTTQAIDIHPGKDLFAVLLKESNGPARVYLYKISTGQEMGNAVITNKINTDFESLRFSPDGNHIAIPMGREKEIAIWTVSPLALLGRKPTDGEAVSVDWHTSGSRLAVVSGKKAEIWTLNPFEREKFINGARSATEWASIAVWSPDGEYLSIGTNNPGLYVDRNGRQGSIPSTKGSIRVAEWNADGSMIASVGFGSNGNINVWKNPKMAVDSPFQKKYELIKTVTSTPSTWWTKLAWDPSGRIIAYGDNQKNLFFLNPVSGQLVKTIQPTNSNTTQFRWKGDYLITVGSYPDKKFKIWKSTVN